MEGYPLVILRVGLAALALYNRPKPTLLGFTVGVIGLLEGKKKNTPCTLGCPCHASGDYVEVLSGSDFNQVAKLLIPTFFIVSHLDHRLCCSTVEAGLVGAMFGNYIRQEFLCESSPPSSSSA